MRDPRPILSRREFARLVGGGIIGALAGTTARAADPAQGRFLFVFARGGWDPTFVFAPKFDSPNIDVEDDAVLAEAGGLAFVDSPEREQVKSFFEAYGDRTCIVNGFEVRSITHERCSRLLFTGTTEATADDWPSTLAGEGGAYELPCVVISGPSYTAKYSSSVMRVGETGQLGGLLDGSALTESDLLVSGIRSDTEDSVHAWLRDRVDAYEVAAGRGRQTRFADHMQTSLDQLELLRELSGEVDFTTSSTSASDWVPVSERALPALACLELGHTRCAVVEHLGTWDMAWDTHDDNFMQSSHYQTLFDDLHVLMEELDSRTGSSGGRLSDEVTVVVISEMGRTPKLNSHAGKDHWTFTSAMIIGPGVQGGRVVGAFDDNFLGAPTDLVTGERDDATGTSLTTTHLGATLLAMGGLDPAEFVSADPILAVLA